MDEAFERKRVMELAGSRPGATPLRSVAEGFLASFSSVQSRQQKKASRWLWTKRRDPWATSYKLRVSVVRHETPN